MQVCKVVIAGNVVIKNMNFKAKLLGCEIPLHFFIAV